MVNPTFYEIQAGHDGWVPGTGNANMVVQGPDLGAINSNSIVLPSLGGGNTGPAVCGAYNTFTNGFNVNCAGSGDTHAVLRVTVFNH